MRAIPTSPIRRRPAICCRRAATSLSGSPFPLPAWQTNETVSYATGLKDIGVATIEDLVFTAHYYWQSPYLANMTGL